MADKRMADKKRSASGICLSACSIGRSSSCWSSSYFTGRAGGELDEVPLLVGLRHPHPAAVPHRLGLRRQHDRALLRFRRRARRRASSICATCCSADARYDAGHNPVGGTMVVVLLFAVLAQVAAGLFSADTDLGTVNGPLANLIADKWVDRLTALPQLLGERAAGPGRPACAGGDRLSRVEATEPDRRHAHRPQAARRRRRRRARPAPTLAFASGRLAVSLLIVAAAIVYFIVRAGG